MGRSYKYQLVEARLGSNLAQQLSYWRCAGVSAEAMARMLEIETSVSVSGEAVRLWLRAIQQSGEAA